MLNIYDQKSCFVRKSKHACYELSHGTNNRRCTCQLQTVRTVKRESDEGIPSFHEAQSSVDVVLVDFAITIDEVT